MYTLIALAKHYLDRPNARFHPIGVAFLYAGLGAPIGGGRLARPKMVDRGRLL